MPSFSQITRFGMVALVLAVVTPPVGANDEPVVVCLTDGSRVKAQIDQRTDAKQLWLTTYLKGGHIAQPIPWEEVHQIEIGKQIFGGQMAQTAVAILREHEPQNRVAEAPRGPTLLAAGPSGGSVPAGRQAESPSVASRVEAMAISAWLSNWDSDVVEDGLLVELVPCDSFGNPIACNGNVDFTLRAWKASEHGGGLETHTEHWSKTIRGAGFESGSVFFRLPFRAIQPHQSSAWWAHGVLEVRLAVPGSGVVQRTLTDLRLRPFEPMRDDLEHRVGRRYLSSENVQREAWNRP